MNDQNQDSQIFELSTEELIKKAVENGEGIIASNGLGTGDGFNGDFKYLRYNNSEYRFEEGSGNYIYKTI